MACACCGLRGVRGLSPRVRGTLSPTTFAISRCGLSPRVRGNLVRGRVSAPSEGSIPACAGEPVTATLTTATNRVYPRVCGGTEVKFRPVDRMMGLSPRVRGNPSSGDGEAVHLGSIPACAGEPNVRQTTYPTSIRTYHLAPHRVNVHHSYDVSLSLDSTVFCLTRSLCSR